MWNGEQGIRDYSLPEEEGWLEIALRIVVELCRNRIRENLYKGVWRVCPTVS